MDHQGLRNTVVEWHSDVKKLWETLCVMVNFMCHLDWNMGCPDIWSNISECVCKNVSGWD